MLLVAPLAAAASASPVQLRPAPWAAGAASSLRTNGFVVLPPDEARVAATLVEAAREETRSRLEMLLGAVGAIGIDPDESAYSFTEICHRARCRWDLRMPDESTAFHALCAEALQHATPVLQSLAGRQQPSPRLVMAGAVVSRSGAMPQHVHTDGDDEGLFTIFIPLVDIEAASDGTSFLPGSHEEADVLAHAVRNEQTGIMEFDASTMAKMISPACPSGGLLCFDYRCAHRGLENGGRERAVAYIVVSTQEGVTDDSNFHEMSLLHDLRHPEMPEHMAETVFGWDR